MAPADPVGRLAITRECATVARLLALAVRVAPADPEALAVPAVLVAADSARRPNH